MWLAAATLIALAGLVTGTAGVARRDVGRCLAMGACMAGYQVCYFTAVTLTGIAVTALIAICSAPIVIALLAAGFLGERLTARVIGALVLGIAGTAALVAGPRLAADLSPGFVAGVVLAFGAGVAYALYVVLAKAALDRTAPLPLAAVTFGAAALLLSPALVVTPAPLSQITLGWPWLLYLGIVATGAAYAIYTVGLASVPASVAGVVTLLEPLTATLLGVLVFDERLGALGLAGAVLLGAAMALLFVTPGRRTPQRQTATRPRSGSGVTPRG
jgi:DME family drug/metabolite transporter